MQVSEAKTKVCPFMSDNTTGKDIDGKYNAVSYCICGDCMAWEYTKIHQETDEITIISSCEVDEEDRSRLTDRHIKVSQTRYKDKIAEKYAIIEDLKGDYKEGYCQRLVK